MSAISGRYHRAVVRQPKSKEPAISALGKKRRSQLREKGRQISGPGMKIEQTALRNYDFPDQGSSLRGDQRRVSGFVETVGFNIYINPVTGYIGGRSEPGADQGSSGSELH